MMYVPDLPVGKSVWTSTRSTWSGRLNLVKADNYSTLTIDGGDVKESQSLSLPLSVSLSLEERMLSTLPSWCSFVGMIMCCSDCW